MASRRKLKKRHAARLAGRRPRCAERAPAPHVAEAEAHDAWVDDASWWDGYEWEINLFHDEEPVVLSVRLPLPPELYLDRLGRALAALERMA